MRSGIVSSALMLAVTATVSAAPINLTSTTYTQDFNTLASTGTSSVLPAGWELAETLTSANTTYAAGTGSSTTGDTYSFGAAANAERAFGILQSNNLASKIGFG